MERLQREGLGGGRHPLGAPRELQATVRHLRKPEPSKRVVRGVGLTQLGAVTASEPLLAKRFAVLLTKSSKAQREQGTKRGRRQEEGGARQGRP